MKKSTAQMKSELQLKLQKLEAKEVAQIKADREKANQLFAKLANAEAKSAGIDFAKVDETKLKSGLVNLMVFLKSD
jgi:hypothetical protein